MPDNGPSRTALTAATARGQHRLQDDAPWVFDDPFALVLVGQEWPQLRTAMSEILREPANSRGRGFQVARARYAEDRLLEGTFTQYVILGAGLDSFAWRRPDLLHSRRVFEVDHPTMQAWKRDRANLLGLPYLDGHILAPVDFEHDTLHTGLDTAGFDWTQPTLFCWLGVVHYLSTEAIEATLTTITACTPGSEIVLSYLPSKPFVDEIDHPSFFRPQQDRPWLEKESLVTRVAPADAVAIVERCGLHVAAHVTADDLYHRYFTGRADGLRPYTIERIITGAVPAPTTRP
jgi:methyltransferase (TIGR00027 family)